MIEAFLKGKLSSEQENMEDLLTAAVFGMLREVDAQKGLIPFIAKAVPVIGEAPPILDWSSLRTDHQRYVFWPTWNHLDNVENCEPDLVIELQSSARSFLVCIEVKYLSGKSSFPTLDGPVSDQLAKQWAHLANHAKRRSCEPWLIYLTTDSYNPRQEIRPALYELEAKSWPGKQESEIKIAWLSWRHLAKLYIKSDMPQLRQLSQLGNYLGLRFFSGFRSFKMLPTSNFSFTQCERHFFWGYQPVSNFEWEFKNE